MPGREGDDAIRSRARDLAQRIQLLQDLTSAERGSTFSFSEIQSALRDRGISLSAGRWSYLTNGEGPLTTDRGLLRALADTFAVDPAFLLDWSDPELPDRLLAHRQLVMAVRRAKIEKFATRALGDLTPESMRAIAVLIESQAREAFRDEG
jgi:hypothetical protein